MASKTIGVWFGINKNGFVSLHLEEPKREGNKWVSNKPYCNSIIQKQIEDLVKRALFNWEMECEYLEFSYTER